MYALLCMSQHIDALLITYQPLEKSYLASLNRTIFTNKICRATYAEINDF